MEAGLSSPESQAQESVCQMTDPFTYAGIDPGRSGAIAVMHPDGSIKFRKMPISPGDIDGKELSWYLTGLHTQAMGNLVVCVEIVNARSRQAHQSSFVRGHGRILGILDCLGITYHEATPQVWKKTILRSKYSHEEKAGAIQWCYDNHHGVNLMATPKCCVLFDGFADALCLAEYAKRMTHDR